MATLRDLDVVPFKLASAGNPPAAAGDRWAVLVEDSKPVSAVAPGTTVNADAALPPIIVAAADRDQDEAFDSGAFAVVSDVAALVLLDGDEVAGVVAGHALRAAIGRGAIRGEFGVILPGVPTSIDWISRSCTYAENGVTCGTPARFIAPPAVMPGCANPRGLAAHQFGW